MREEGDIIMLKAVTVKLSPISARTRTKTKVIGRYLVGNIL